MSIVSLDHLRAGEKGEVVAIHGADDVVHRLAERGLRAGCLVAVVVAGSPAVIRIGGTTLSLRADEIEVMVHRLDEPMSPAPTID